MDATAASVQSDEGGTRASSSWLTREERRAVTARSLALGLAILAAHYALYFATILGAVADLPLALNILSALVNGLVIGQLFIIGHDCVHRAYVPGARLNWWLGRLAFVPCAHSVSLWEIGHNKKHHGRTNLKGYDYVWAPLTKAEYDALSRPRRFLERVYRGPLGPFVYYYFGIWAPRILLPLEPETRPHWRRHLPDTLFVLVMLGGAIAGILAAGAWLAPERPLWLTFLAGWALPFAVWNYLMALSIYLQHTHPRVPWFDDEAEWRRHDGNIRGTTHIDFPFKFVPLFRMVMEHAAHHALSSVPIYNLRAAEAKLLAARSADIVQYRLTWPAYRAVTRACKLYDFRNHVWTDFEGRPTSARTIPA